MLVTAYDWTIQSLVNLENNNKIIGDSTIQDTYLIPNFETLILNGLTPYTIVLNRKQNADKNIYYTIIEGQKVLNTLVAVYEQVDKSNFDIISNHAIRVYVVMDEKDETVRDLLDLIY